MANPKEGNESLPSQGLQELFLLENSLQQGEAQLLTPEQSTSSQSGDSQSVKTQVVGGPVEACGPLAEVLQQTHAWEEGNEDALAELKVMEVVQGLNEFEKDQHGIQRLPQSGRGLAKHRSKMEELEVLQLELSCLKACYSGAFAWIKTRVAKIRRSHFERRKSIIQGIPGFWSKAMMNHPQMSSIISNQDEDLLSYMKSLEVEEYNLRLKTCRMMFYFSDNPYFQNEVVTKDYQFSITGYEESDSSAIQWVGQAEHACPNCMQDTTRLTFLSWLCAYKLPGTNRIAEIIIDDLWPNPLYYYPKEDQS